MQHDPFGKSFLEAGDVGPVMYHHAVGEASESQKKTSRRVPSVGCDRHPT